MYELVKKLFPICRSITGNGFRESLEILNKELNNIMNIHQIKSGTSVFDWTVPDEWNIKDAYIITPDGKKICDFKKNNLHIMNYSTPINQEMSLSELDSHLYSLPDMEDAIPYVTSYYKKRWGFCISHKERLKLKNGIYKVFIDSSHNPNGVLNYADFVIPANNKTDDEILISTYLCHPSMVNNEISGPVVATYLAKWILENKDTLNLKYNYRFVFIPETIGSICYLSKNLIQLQKNVKAGFNLSCLADNLAYSLIHTPCSNTLSDKAAMHVLKDKKNFKEYDFLDSGSDERQYCSPLINLPICGICRSKYNEYTQYHTSLDDLNFINNAEGLENSLDTMIEIIKTIETNQIYISNVFCEPNLGKRGLYPTLSILKNDKSSYYYRKFIALCDGKNDCIDIAERLGIKAYELKKVALTLLEKKLIRIK